ncbi:tRNA synthetases class I (M)-domain-containing protein [Tuber borchii]|uniref:Probable methionine--tRNA ligase, mitochondrial n=1 Tax=Tuber borchii TaxID=42251 RepID=A0A2T6ZQA3_TUBBO|nr:tRNA synthetases class I (M)-domain-containing protein [Tuber borchii]
MRTSLWQFAQQRLATRNWICQRCLPVPRKQTKYTSDAKQESEKPYYVTTPIFYVNADPHIGHLYSMILADVLKRWQLLLGRKALLSTGTDEHGMKIQQAAEVANIPPKEFCDMIADRFKNLAAEANVSYDFFIRTSSPAHAEAVKYIWHRLEDAGYIYADKHKGWYSVSDETFYPESGIASVVDPVSGRKQQISIETQKVVEWTEETNYHFRLSALAPRLLEFYRANLDWIVPRTRYKEVIAAVENGLEDLSISRPRSRLHWGIPVPTDSTQTIYVWLDALANYLTNTAYPTWPPPPSTSFWPADTHVIGKDILRFHAIYWPAFLLALNLPPPRRILTHAHWTMNRRKMSKSTGNAVNPSFALYEFGVDALRFYLLHEGGITDDGDYDVRTVITTYKKGCVDGLGNLAGRIRGRKFDLARAVKRFCIEEFSLSQQLPPEAQAHHNLLQKTPQLAAEKMKDLHPNLALKEIMNAVYETNKYLQHAAPWAIQDPTQQDLPIYLSAEAVRITGILLQPFMPGKMKELLDGLGVRADRRGFEHAVVGGDSEYGAVVVVKEEDGDGDGDGVGVGVGDEGRKRRRIRGVLFPPPANEGFDQ